MGNTTDNFDPHNIPFCVLGTFVLWFGWYGFNPGIVFAAWSGTMSAIVFLPCRLAGVLRLSDEFQKDGADLREHSPSKAYATAKLVEANADGETAPPASAQEV